MTTDTFLSSQEVAELTGIQRGRAGRTRNQLQVAALTAMRVPHYVNPAGFPKVVRATIEGGRAPRPVATWAPSIVA